MVTMGFQLVDRDEPLFSREDKETTFNVGNGMDILARVANGDMKMDRENFLNIKDAIETMVYVSTLVENVTVSVDMDLFALPDTGDGLDQ